MNINFKSINKNKTAKAAASVNHTSYNKEQIAL